MMKTTRPLRIAAPLLVVALALAGCVPSLNPLYRPEDLTFDAALVGVWVEKPDSEERWIFEKAGETGYRVTYDEKGSKGTFEVHLLRLGDRRYLDFHPEDDGIKELARNDFYKFHWLSAHTFARLDQVEPRLQMAFLSPEWLKKHLEEKPRSIAHVRRGKDEIILTATTAELQAFVREHAAAAFDDPSDLQRISPAQPATTPTAVK
jgi:hypothetical protein